MPRNLRADESILNSATSTSGSLRVTIPSFIVAKENLKKGDTFRWHRVKGGLFIEIFNVNKEEIMESIPSEIVMEGAED